MTEEALEQQLFPPLVGIEAPAKALPDFDYIYRELKAHKKFNLTLDQLWREYREQHPDGYQYSQFCQLYRDYRSKLDSRCARTTRAARNCLSIMAKVYR